MRTGIATVSLSGVLPEKLAAVADAGFDGIEVFDNDLVASAMSPHEVAARCSDLGLRIDLFQPVRDVEGVPPGRFAAVEHRVRTKLSVMGELGADLFLACSNVSADAVDDPDLSAEQLARLGDLAADHGVRIAFEALAWGRHVGRVRDAWEIVRRADHPAVMLAIDTFHMLARGDDGSALADIPGDRMGFLQVADAPLMEMSTLEWSRHHRCFPGQGGLDVEGVVAAALDAGYDGPLSLEVFSDVVREVEPHRTALSARRSLLFLEDQVASLLDGADPRVAAAPAPPTSVDSAFLELTSPSGDSSVPALLAALGFVHAGTHVSKPVHLWRAGGADVVVNEELPRAPRVTALGVRTAAVETVAARAEALLWPAPATVRREGEAPLPGVTAPSGLHVFLSGDAGGHDDWQRDFVPTGGPGGPIPGAFTGIDHVGVSVAGDDLDDEVGFFRTLFGLAPGQVEEFMEPQGRLRSRALRPRRGDLRLVLNVEETGSGDQARQQLGVNQVALRCDDVRSVVRRMRAGGLELIHVPDNYYVDLAARFDLPAELLADLRDHGLFYDRVGEGELLHAYTPVLPTGFYVEVLERRGGYDGYGSPSTHVRLAAQSSSASAT